MCLNNPFVDINGYQCFGCDPNNLQGLKMEFAEENDEIVSHWTPKQYFCGYNDMLHGGIQATLCDEIASWTVYVKCNCAGVTSKLTMKYKSPVIITKGDLTLRSRIKENKRNKVAIISVSLYDGAGDLCAEAEAVFWMFSHEESVSHYGYPENHEAFYK